MCSNKEFIEMYDMLYTYMHEPPRFRYISKEELYKYLDKNFEIFIRVLPKLKSLSSGFTLIDIDMIEYLQERFRLEDFELLLKFFEEKCRYYHSHSKYNEELEEVYEDTCDDINFIKEIRGDLKKGLEKVFFNNMCDDVNKLIKKYVDF